MTCGLGCSDISSSTSYRIPWCTKNSAWKQGFKSLLLSSVESGEGCKFAGEWGSQSLKEPGKYSSQTNGFISCVERASVKKPETNDFILCIVKKGEDR